MKFLSKTYVLSSAPEVSYSSKDQRSNSHSKSFTQVENKIKYPKTTFEKIFTKTNESNHKVSLTRNSIFYKYYFIVSIAV